MFYNKKTKYSPKFHLSNVCASILKFGSNCLAKTGRRAMQKIVFLNLKYITLVWGLLYYLIKYTS